MKRLTAILLSALLVLSLAACGNSNQNTVEDTPAETEVTTPTTEPDDSSTEESTEEPTDDETENAETSDTAEAGSGFSGTIQTISELQPNATIISDGLSISRNSVSGAESDVVEWVNGLNLDVE